jgi:hypothetical protein
MTGWLCEQKSQGPCRPAATWIAGGRRPSIRWHRFTALEAAIVFAVAPSLKTHLGALREEGKVCRQVSTKCAAALVRISRLRRARWRRGDRRANSHGGGCDYQFTQTILGGNFVFGALADYTWSDIHGQTNTYAHYFNEVGVGVLNNNSSSAASGRIGYVIPSLPQLLTYVSGGYSQAHFQGVNYVNSLPPVIGANTSLNLPGHTYDGWFLGGGTAYRKIFTKNGLNRLGPVFS